MKNKKSLNEIKNMKFQLYGWMLFIFCALLFILSGAVNRDILTFAGSVVFFVACIFFIVPLLSELSDSKK
ncbi:MAG: hypothetical protein C0602_01375 [Denitrovibrio sp.]|nr:MAG: hypothetical protein C0602_01375 [Denitrovibrio sp.]